MFKGISFCSVILLLFECAALGGVEPGGPEYAELNFTPYVSSFLPVSEGHLFFGNKGASSISQQAGNSRVSEKFGVPVSQYSLNRDKDIHDIPIIDKFELLRRRVLNGVPKSRSSYVPGFYNPKAEAWEGVCNQWSGAALEPQIVNLLKDLGPIQCAGITLSPSELRELFTAFYKHIEETKFVGKRNNAFSSVQEKFETALGYDDLAPDLFHSTLFDNLKNNQGVVMDKEHGASVWNHPIYKARSSSQHHSKISELETSEATLIPLELLQSSDTKMQKELESLRKEEIKLRSSLQELVARQHRQPYFFEKWIDDDDHVQKKKLQDFVDRKRSLLSQPHIELRSGVSVKKKRTTLTFLSESAFGIGGLQPDKSMSQELNLDYLYFEKEGNLISSSWITPADKRPDFLWIPSQKIIDNEAFQKYSPEMKDLISIIENCKPAQDLASYYQDLNRALNDSEISESEKTKLKEGWNLVRDKADKSWIQQKVIGIKGINASDFD